MSHLRISSTQPRGRHAAGLSAFLIRAPRCRCPSSGQPWEQRHSAPRKDGTRSLQDLKTRERCQDLQPGASHPCPRDERLNPQHHILASSTYQRSLSGRGQQQAAQSGYGATRSQPRWPVGSCHNSLQGSTQGHPGQLSFQPSLSSFGPATSPCSWTPWDARTERTAGEPPTHHRKPTFTAIGGDLSKGVVTAVTLAPNDAWLAGTLAVLRVTDAGQRARGVAVAEEAGGAARGPVVVLLRGRREDMGHWLRFSPGCSWVLWAVAPLEGGSLNSGPPGSGIQNI